MQHTTFGARVAVLLSATLGVFMACLPTVQPTATTVVLPATGTPTTAPSTPAPYPPGFIPHPTGKDDLVLQLARPDGFIPREFLRTTAPLLSLYGDGTVIFLSYKDDSLNGRLYTTNLGEEHIQALLRYAVQDARFFSSRERYPDVCGCDNFWTSITVQTDGQERTASAYALVAFRGQPPDWPHEDVEQWGRLVAFKERLEKTITDLEQDPNGRRYISDSAILHVQRLPAYRYFSDPSRAVLPWPLEEVDLENMAATVGASRAAVLEGAAAWAVQLKLPLHAIHLYKDKDVVYQIDYRPRLPSDWTWNAGPPPHVGSISPVPFSEVPASLEPDGLCAGFRFNTPTRLGNDPTARVTLTLDGRDVTTSLSWVLSLDASLGNACYHPPESLTPGPHTAVLSYTDAASAPYTYTWDFVVQR